jgi:hypothetical protein
VDAKPGVASVLEGWLAWLLRALRRGG